MAARNKLFGLISLLIENQRNKKIGGKQGVDLIKSKANCMPARVDFWISARATFS
ncbi:MAG: hypothetical protein WAK04_21205 [Xanthobacteraceae bacterium]|jgi:hypothetical protein